MKILVDVSAGPAVAEALRKLGHDVVEVVDLDEQLEDEQILAWGGDDGRLVVTMDKDFGELVFRLARPHAGVLLLRLEDEHVAAKLAAVDSIFPSQGEALVGRFSVYQAGRLRVR